MTDRAILSEQLTIGPCDVDPKKHVELRRAWKHFLPQPLGGVEPRLWRYVRHPHVTGATAGTSFESAQLAFEPRDLAEEHVDLAAIRFEAPSEVARPLVVTAPASGRTNLGQRWSELGCAGQSTLHCAYQSIGCDEQSMLNRDRLSIT